MKTINKNNNLFLRIPFFAVLTAILIAVPLRVYHYLKLINPTTGFFDKNDFTITLLYIILAFAIVLCVALSYISHKSIQPVTIGKNSKIFLAVSSIMAFGAALSAINLFTDFMSTIENAPSYLSKEEIYEYASAQGGTLMLFEGVFAAISAIYFILSGLPASTKSAKPRLRLLALSPVVWCVFRLLFRFKRTISFVNVSDLLLELFAIVFSMVFFLALAQIRSKIDADNIFWKIYAYGLPAAMLSLVCFIPRFILLITGQSESLNSMHPVYFSDLTFAVYSIFICITSTKAEVKKAED